MFEINKLHFLSLNFQKEKENVFSVFLSSFIINLLAFYHKCNSLIGYATHVLFYCRYCVAVHWEMILCVFKVSLKRI